MYDTRLTGSLPEVCHELTKFGYFWFDGTDLTGSVDTIVFVSIHLFKTCIVAQIRAFEETYSSLPSNLDGENRAAQDSYAVQVSV